MVREDNIDTLGSRTAEQIITDRDIAIQEERYEDAAKFRDELKNTQEKETIETNTDTIDEAQKFIDEAAAENRKKEREEENMKEEVEKKAKIKELTEKLNNSAEKNEKLEQQLKLLKDGLDKIRKDRESKIDEIKKANVSDVDKLNADLKKIQEEKDKLESEFFGKVNFKDDIKEADIKKITSKMLRIGATETDKRWRKTLIGYEKMPIRMTRRRMTVKTIAKMFNEIGDKPTQGVDFIMAFTKTRFGRYTRQGDKITRRNMLRKANIGRNLEAFGTKYNQQKQKVMTVLTWGMRREELPPEEQVVIKAIEKRMDYYGKKYLQDIYNQNGKEKIK